MNIRVLGAHSRETATTKYTSLLVDDVLALDAGSLASSLSIPAQKRLKAILVTHEHYDHVRDIPAIALNMFRECSSIQVCATPEVLIAIETHLLNGSIYPPFQDMPQERPSIRFTPVAPYEPVEICGYEVMPVPVNHSAHAVGYQVTDARGKAVFFYTGDTGPLSAECWQHLSPQLLVTETTFPARRASIAIRTRHLTPSGLHHSLIAFRQLKAYLPEVAVVHMDPAMETETAQEIAGVAGDLGASITMAHANMLLPVPEPAVPAAGMCRQGGPAASYTERETAAPACTG